MRKRVRTPCGAQNIQDPLAPYPNHRPPFPVSMLLSHLLAKKKNAYNRRRLYIQEHSRRLSHRKAVMMGSDILMSLGQEPTDMYPDPKLIVLGLAARGFPPGHSSRQHHNRTHSSSELSGQQRPDCRYPSSVTLSSLNSAG